MSEQTLPPRDTASRAHSADAQESRPDVTRTVRILFTLNRAYLPMFFAVARGVFDHRNPERDYELLVMSDDLSATDLDEVAASTTPEPNQTGSFTYRLIELDHVIELLGGALPGEGFAVQVLFRLLAPQLMPDIERVVYLDCDLVVLDDVGVLFDQDLGGALLGACVDPGMAGMVGGYDLSERDRLTDELGLTDPYSYFCAGVLLWDLARTRTQIDPDILLEFVRTHHPRYGDQDALNHVFQGTLLRHLDMRWDVLYDSEGIRVSKIVPHAPEHIREQYLQARRNPSIFHFAGPYKPWQRRVDGSSLFWRAARVSAGYEDLLSLYAANTAAEKDTELMGKVWKTFDDLYFRTSELERIQHDLHLRTTQVEQRCQDLEQRVQELEARRRSLPEKLVRKIQSNRQSQ